VVVRYRVFRPGEPEGHVVEAELPPARGEVVFEGAFRIAQILPAADSSVDAEIFLERASYRYFVSDSNGRVRASVTVSRRLSPGDEVHVDGKQRTVLVARRAPFELADGVIVVDTR
jgi:hypothetical protein